MQRRLFSLQSARLTYRLHDLNTLQSGRAFQVALSKIVRALFRYMRPRVFSILYTTSFDDPDYLFNSLKTDAVEKREIHSVVGIPLPAGKTGIEALRSLASTFNSYITGAQFYCETKGDLLWIERTTSATDWSNAWPVLQYNLSIILLGVRRTLGRELRPIALKLPVMQTDGNLPDTLRNIPITLNRDRFGMGFNLEDIVTAGFTLRNHESTLKDGSAAALDENLREAFASCLSMFLISSTTDKLSDRVAKSFGFSPRTYRRQMANLGTSHATMLSDVRLDLALKLLEDDCVSVETVSIELGYAHPGHFTRFFKTYGMLPD